MACDRFIAAAFGANGPSRAAAASRFRVRRLLRGSDKPAYPYYTHAVPA